MHTEPARHHPLHGVQPVLTVADLPAGLRGFPEVPGFERGAEVVEPPSARPQGLRGFLVREPQGHVLRFCAESAKADPDPRSDA